MAALQLNLSRLLVVSVGSSLPQHLAGSVRLLSSNKQSRTSHSSSFQTCQDLVMKYDHENFLATLLIPKGPCESVIAVRAFNVTVSQVRDQVTQPMIGEMRMKFWSDCVVSIYQDNPPAQPVAIQLHKAIRKHNLSKRWLQRILSSREEIMNDKSFQNLAALETYSENSVSSVLYLVLECMNFRDVNADHAASHIGRAQGLITLLRAMPYNASKQRVYVPLDLLVKHSVSQHNIIRGSSEKNVKDLVFDVASTANAHLEKAKSLIGQVPKDARIALLPSVCVSSYLERLRKADFNVFDGQLQLRNQLLPWALWWNKILKTY